MPCRDMVDLNIIYDIHTLTSVPGANAFIYGLVRMCSSALLTWSGPLIMRWPSLPVVATSGVVSRQTIPYIAVYLYMRIQTERSWTSSHRHPCVSTTENLH